MTLRVPSRRALAVILTFAGLSVIVGSSVFIWNPDVRPYVAAVDSLPLPSSWQVVRTVAFGDGGTDTCIRFGLSCPSVRRYYEASGPLTDIYVEARTALVAAGFTRIEDFRPTCDLITNAARCVLFGSNGDVSIDIFIFDPGTDPDEVGVGTPGLATIRIVSNLALRP